MIFSLIVGFVLGVFAIVFILQNTAIVALHFMGWQFQSSLAILTLLAILFGILLSLLVSIPGSIGNSLRVGKLKRDNDALRKEAETNRRAAEEAKARLNAPVVVVREN